MNRLVKILLLAAFANALAWIILIPIWQYPDEQAHFAQVQYIAEKGGIPQGSQSLDTSYEVTLSEKILDTERDEFGNNKFTYHPEYKLSYSDGLYGPQEEEILNLPKSARSRLVKNEATLNPPLYYNLSSVVYKIFSPASLFTRVFAIRIMSALILMGTILVAFKIGKLIFEDNILPITLAAIVGFKPMLVFASTGVLPDTMVILLFSLFIFFCLKIIKNGFSQGNALGILLTVITGSMTRQNFLISLFILPLVFSHQLIFNKQERQKIVFFALSATVLLFIASFFLPALDFIRRFDYPESSGKNPLNPLFNLAFFDHLAWTLEHTFREVWPWYWGIYKWLSLALPHIIYQIINRLTLLAIVGLIIKLVWQVRKKELKKELPLLFLVSTVFIYFLLITIFDYQFRKNNGYSFGIQGRYFFPPVIAEMAILLTGFWFLFKTFAKNYAKFFVFILVITFFVFNLVSQIVVAASYYDVTSLQIFVNEASQYKPLVFKGNILILIFSVSLLLQAIFLTAFTKYIIKDK